MYLIGFAAAFWLAGRRLHRTTWTKEELSDMLFYGFIGVILGGRIGYVFFYQFDLFLSDPLYLFKIWTGGMSFHGGLLGVVAALYWFARKKTNLYFLCGRLCCAISTHWFRGLAELVILSTQNYGDVPRMSPGGSFSQMQAHYPRHPSQLYEFFLEGVVLFAMLWLYSKKRPSLSAR